MKRARHWPKSQKDIDTILRSSHLNLWTQRTSPIHLFQGICPHPNQYNELYTPPLHIHTFSWNMVHFSLLHGTWPPTLSAPLGRRTQCLNGLKQISLEAKPSPAAPSWTRAAKCKENRMHSCTIKQGGKRGGRRKRLLCGWQTCVPVTQCGPCACSPASATKEGEGSASW